MAAKKCLICNCSLSGRRDAKTCSARCRKRLQLVKLSFVRAPERRQLAKTLSLLIIGMFGVLSMLLSLWSAPVNAATSDNLNFQARLLTSSGQVVPDGNYHIEFKIYDSVSSGASAQGVCSLNSSTDDCWWLETRTTGNLVRVVNGYFSVNLGSLTAFGASIPWDQPLWLTMNIGGTGGSPSWDGEMLASGNRVKLTGVPYAFRAGSIAKNNGTQTGTLSFNTVANSPVITIPDASGTICLQSAAACGFATGSGSAFLQGGNSFTTAGTLGTNDNFGLNFEVNNTTVASFTNGGLFSLQPAASLTSGQTHITQTLTNASSTGGTVNGYSQTITTSNTVSASTTNGLNISLTDNTSLANTNRGISINLTGTNTSQVQFGLTAAVNRGVGLQGSSSGTTGFNYDCGPVNSNSSLGVCGSTSATAGGVGVIGGAAGSSGLLDVQSAGAGVIGINSGSGANAATYAGVKGISAMGGGNTYTSVGVYGEGQGGSAATAYGGYFTLNPSSTATSGAALYASNSTVATNILQLQDNTTSVVTVANGGATTFQNQTNSTTAFQVQNAAAGNLFSIDSINSNITLNGNNSGEIQDWQTNGTSLPQGRHFSTTATANGYVYVVGGWSSTTAASVTNTVMYAKLNANGSVGSWGCQATTSTDCGGSTPVNANVLPVKLAAPSSVISNGYIYVVGGSDSSNIAQTSIYYAKLNANGTTGSWNTLAANLLPQKRKDHSSVIANGYLYVTAGHNDTGAMKTTLFAKIKNDGTLGSWQCETNAADIASCGTATLVNQNPLPGLRIGHSSVIANGYMYVVGGGNGTPLRPVWYAQINTNGTLGAWQTNANNTPSDHDGASSYVANGYIYVMGAHNSNPVSYALLNSNGSTGTWTASTKTVPQNRGFFGSSGITVNGYMYVMGGSNNFGSPATNVYYTSTSRTKLAGSLDLVGIGGQDLLDAGSQAGSLTAGNTNILGELNVRGLGTFAQGLNVDQQLTVNGGALIKGSAESSNIFQLQNAGNINLLNFSTINQVANSNFESGSSGVAPDGWTAKGASTITTDNTQALFGVNSMKVVTTTAANDGAKYAYPLKPSTQYTLSLYAKVASGSITDFVVGRVDVSSDINCLTGQTVNTTWTRFSCTFTTGTPDATSPTVIYVQKSSASAETFFIDGLQLETAAAATDYRNGDISIDSLATFKSTANSTTAFQIQNAAGSSLLAVDSTVGGNITLLGNNSAEIGSWTTSGNTLSAAKRGAVTVAGNGYAYVISGNTSGSNGTDTVYYAKLNADGTVGSWTNQGSVLPGNRVYSSGTVANGYIYVVGGGTTTAASTAQATVYYAKLNANGSTGTWVSQSPSGLAARQGPGVVTANGYIYAIAGLDTGSVQTSTVQYAKLNADGSTGIWATTNALPVIRQGGAATVANGYVYYVGGFISNGNTFTTTVQYAKLNKDGTTGTWSCQGTSAATSCGGGTIPNANVLNTGRSSAGGMAAVLNGYIYILGGEISPGATFTTAIEYAALNSDGTTGTWTTNTSVLPGARGDAGAITSNGYVYFIGGDNGSAQSSVYHASTSRLKLGGSLDLVGLSGENLNEGGSGGTLTAGNTSIIGTLNVQDAASFMGGVFINGDTVSNSSILQSQTSSTYLSGLDLTNGGSSSNAANGVVISGRYAYLVKSSNGGTCSATDRTGCELQIYDSSNPASPAFVGGADNGGVTTGAIVVSGRYAYIGKSPNATACSSAVGTGCELSIFDISNPANPTYVGGADSLNSGVGVGETFYTVSVSGRYAYIGKGGNNGTCSATTRDGCELQIYDISNPTNPLYVNGVDSNNATGTGNSSMFFVAASGRYVYIGRQAAGGTCSSSVSTGCDLQIYDVSSPTNPTYSGGADSGGSATRSISGVYISGRYAYFTRDGDSGTCSSSVQTGCELQIFDISNPASPTYVGGADGTNAGTGADNFSTIYVAGRYAYVGKVNNAGTCSTGTRDGCELMVFDISAVSNPVFVTGSDTGNDLNNLSVAGRYTYVARSGSVSTCSGSTITGCELQIYENTGIEATSVTAYSLFAGTLQVQNNANFSDNVSISAGLSVGQNAQISGSLGVGGSAIFRNSSNSTTALQVQNAAGGSLFQIDSLNSNITINGDNSGIVQAWQTGNNSGFSSRDSYAQVFANGYVYVIAGNSGASTLSTVQYAKVNANGNVGNWSTTTSIPAVRANPSAAVANGYIYVTAGSVDNTNAGATDTVYYGKLNKDGTISSWTTSANPINVSGSQKRWQHSTIAYNGYLYVINGIDDGANIRNSVYYSKLNADGSNGTWAATNNAALSTGQSAVVANGYVYTAGRNSTVVEYAKLNMDGTTGTWSTTTALPVSRQFGSMGVANGYLYFVGGSNGSTTYYANTYFAPLNADGTIGSWSCQGSAGDCTGTTPVNSTALPATRSGTSNTNIIYNGYLYIIGGWNGSVQSTVYYTSTARVQINGSLDLVGNSGENLAEGGSGGSLTAGNTNIVGTLRVADETNLQGNLYLDGNLNSQGYALFKNSSNSTAAFQVQNSTGSNLLGIDSTNGGNITLFGNYSGEASSWTTQGSNLLPAARRYHSTTAGNGYIYVTGGENAAGTDQSTVYYAKVNNDGSTGAWTTSANALPFTLLSHSSVVANGYIYVIGGSENGSTGTNNIRYAKLNSDGSNGTWTLNATTVTSNRANHTSIVANGYLYVIGGSTTFGGAGQNTVYYAKLNADGSVGAFASANTLSSARSWHSSVVANGYVYALAGDDSSAVQTNTVQYAKLNLDGTTGTWTSQGSNLIPANRSDGLATVSNGYVYYLGGVLSGAVQSTVYFAQLNSDGTSGAWTTSANALPAVRNGAGQQTVSINGYQYFIGGDHTNGTNANTNVYYTSTARLKVGANLDLIGLGGENLAEGGSGGSLTAGNTFISGSLQATGGVQFWNSLSVDKTLAVNGSALFKNAADSTTAFQIQNAAGASLLTLDTSNLILKLSGNTTTFATLTLDNARVKATQTTAPTIGTPTNCGTTPSAAVTTASTDSAGSFTITAGTGSPTTCDTVFTFNKAYGAAPKSIILTPTTAVGSATGFKEIQVSATSTTTFTIKITTNPAASEVNSFYYWVIE